MYENTSSDVAVTCSLPIPSYVLHAGAPNVTELTFDRESRTLTCTSTGGPATTVTWTKDGAVITPNTTHQQTQMIVDTVEGIYQNTLTIAQSVTGDDLYGLYSCMVENSRGSSNKTIHIYGKHYHKLYFVQACRIKLMHRKDIYLNTTISENFMVTSNASGYSV